MAVSDVAERPAREEACGLAGISASDWCTVSQSLIQPTRTTSPIRSSPCASAAIAVTYPCICIRGVAGRVEIGCA